MQFCTEQMVVEIGVAADRVDQICQQSVLRIVSITEEDHKNLASDLVKLDKALYWTDFKESFKLAAVWYINFPEFSRLNPHYFLDHIQIWIRSGHF